MTKALASVSGRRSSPSRHWHCWHDCRNGCNRCRQCTTSTTRRSQSPSNQGLPTMIRQSGDILHIVIVTCSRSNRVLGFDNQHRVHSLVKGLCRTANLCKPVHCGIACNGLCTAARFHTAETNPGCLLGCHEGSIAYGITIDVLPCSTTFVPCGLGPAKCISPSYIQRFTVQNCPSK